MAINKNHEFEELNGVKCGIVEKNVMPQRVEFLKKILEYNHYTVVVVPTPPPKVAAPPPPSVSADGGLPNAIPKEGEPAVAPPPAPPLPETFTVGVTDYTFNTINAIFGRMLKTPDGHIVTLAYWNQKEEANNDEVPYYEQNN